MIRPSRIRSDILANESFGIADFHERSDEVHQADAASTFIGGNTGQKPPRGMEAAATTPC
jgi:hypothetical protein